ISGTVRNRPPALLGFLHLAEGISWSKANLHRWEKISPITDNSVPLLPPEGSGCKLCPSHWQLHRDKCYWLSKKAKDWTMGHEDCSRKNSHLLMIQDWEEMVFIQNITKQQNEVWIGLNITSPGRSWTWVDGSPLNKKLFTVLGPAEEKSCAAIRNNKIQSESCLTRYCWICQKEAVLI
uniref:C-type lectin domain-containing protein n=1 Tax=Pelusios castaneus TaxID=367368 RepID=A0A8C8VGP2_9SAUR